MRNGRYAASVVAAGMMPCLAFSQGSTGPADGYPARPVRVVVAQGAGGNADVQARLFAAKLGESLGRQFIVDNRPGRHISWTLVAKAPADGYTLLVVLPDFIYAPALFSNLPVDPARDFAPISLMSRTPYLLVINPAVAAKSVKELIALANAAPGKLSFGGGIVGRLNSELVAIAKSPEAAGALGNDNSEPVGTTPGEFRRFIANEIPRWRKLVRDSGITVD